MQIQTIKSSFNKSKYFDKAILNVDCGEISMLADAGIFEKDGILYEHLGDICNLGSLNICEYVIAELYANRTTPLPDWNDGCKDEFDWNQFAHDTELLVRGLDNLIDISGYPLEELATAAKLRRKIGAGIFGYGSALMMMGMKYGSEEAMAFTKRLMSTFVNVAYQTSATLAKEKGSFLLYDADKIFEGGFIANSGLLYDDTLNMIRENGLRNSQLLAVAPTGNLSIYAGCISGGIEPVFELDYWRWAIMNHKTNELLAGLKYPQYERGEWFETDDFKFTMRGDDQVLISNDGKLMIDKNRGLTQKINIKEYAFDVITDDYSDAVIADYRKRGVFTTAQKLTAEEHLDPFILLGKYIDNSISKTINLPNDYPIEDFDELYKKLWRERGRGVTTYRDGTMMAVLETKKDSKKDAKTAKKEQKEFFDVWKEHELGEVVPHQVDLPSEYPMKGRKIVSEGKKWYVSLAYKDKAMKRPFAVFVSTNNRESDIIASGVVESLTELAESEGIALEHIEDNERKCAGQANVNKIARTLSLLLRHNVKIDKIVKVLDLIDLPISSLVYRLKKLLMEYIFEMENGMTCPQCGEKVVFEEGCIRCSQCTWSKC